jgi:hypothetical protein
MEFWRGTGQGRSGLHATEGGMTRTEKTKNKNFPNNGKTKTNTKTTPTIRRC